VCNQVLTICYHCGGSGIKWASLDTPNRCEDCNGTGTHPRAGHRCTLDREHTGACDDKPVQASAVDEMEIEVE